MIVSILLAAGSVLRIGWLFTVGSLAAIPNESHHIAVSLAESGRFAGAFGPDTGPTAHLAPMTPIVTAAAYSLFGTGTPLATLVLSLQAIAVVMLACALAHRALGELGTPQFGRLAGLAVVALLPLQFPVEVRDLRYWEAGIAAAAIAAMLLWILRLDRSAIPIRTLAMLGLANGSIMMLNPAAGLACSGMIGLLLIRRVRFIRWPVPVAGTLAVVLTVTVPWTLRNIRELGTPILSRSSLGISLGAVYHDGQLAKDRATAYRHRSPEVTPLFEPARTEHRRVGEVAFNRRLGSDARAWIAAHPAETLRIRAENLRDFYFPPVWHFNKAGTPVRGARERAALMWLASAGALSTIAAMLLWRQWRYLYVGLAVLLPCIPYVFVYSLLRYRYIVSTLLIFLACDGAARLWRVWRHHRRIGLAAAP